MATPLSLLVEANPMTGRLPAPPRPAGVAIGYSDSESDAPTESEDEADAPPAQEDDEFVFDAPAYYDLANPALERRYVNNADGYFSSPAPSAATTVASPPSEAPPAPVEVKSDHDQQVAEEPLARALMRSYSGMPSGADEARSAPASAAASAFSQTVPSFGAFSQAVPSLGNQAAASIHIAPPTFGKPQSGDAGNNASADAEMDESETKPAVLSPVPFHPEDNQVQHEQDVDEHMSDAGSEGTVEMNTSVIMADVEAPSAPLTAQAIASAAEYEEEDAESVASILSRSLLSEGAPETLEEVLEHYASSSQSSATSYRMRDIDASRGSIHSSQGSISPRHASHHFQQPRSQPNMHYGAASYHQPPRSTGSYSTHSSVPSSLLQPTQSFIRRVQAEQRLREETYMEDFPVQDKPHRVTKPHSPKLRTSRKAEAKPHDPTDISRMSSTSRELLKIQEERLRLQMERMKIREFHERTKVHRPPVNIFQRSTKQLTIPQSPHLSVDGRSRRSHRDASIDSNAESAEGDAEKPAMITPESLLSREYKYPATKTHSNLHNGPPHPTIPHTPQLQTAARSSRRGIVPDPHQAERPRRPPTATTSRGLTQPATPSLETRRRAQAAASYRRPIDVPDKDEEELSKKFRARPLNKKILEPKLQSPSKSLDRAAPPKPSTHTATRMSAGDMERRRQEREQQRAASSARAASAGPRRPVVPETPPLKSIQLHRQYQEQFRRRIEEEQKELERKRDFKANPMRVTSTPPRFEGSSKPLTEIKPFAMPGERHHELARERFEAKKREEEERLKESAKFRANPMPVFSTDSGSDSDRASKPSAKPLTTFAAPVLASDRRAAERAAFDAAERERREMEEAYRKRVEAEAKRLEEEEIRRMRKEAMVFHARPAPEPKSYALRSNNQIDNDDNQ